MILRSLWPFLTRSLTLPLGRTLHEGPFQGYVGRVSGVIARYGVKAVLGGDRGVSGHHVAVSPGGGVTFSGGLGLVTATAQDAARPMALSFLVCPGARGY